jgi:hypothetical protein
MQRQQITPAQKSLRRALAGAGVLAACLWLSPVILAVLQSPGGGGLWFFVSLWGFAAVMGLAALLVGLIEAGLSVVPNRLAAVWAAWGLIGIGVLLVKFVPADAMAAYLVRALYVSGAAILAVYFWIASGCAAANARRVMRRQLKQRNVPLQPARPRPARRWFFLWLW